ncbi:hypothetical protein [Paraliomyxa miuraensis]|uniref:hypothetical protein n=1 Tax=Paraliomyxa miuraensis TaxID=376150 RepID=UPI00225764B3|nr:hypothetical protein [Paraliomyxa miuraensis]MCX4247453.1 hypothetical protein [Paraliomyxa miuraensis]
MRWGCTWGSSWGSGTCPACTPFVHADGEPKFLVAVPVGPSIGSLVDVGRFIGTVTQAPQYWYFGSIVAGKPTIDDC